MRGQHFHLKSPKYKYPRTYREERRRKSEILSVFVEEIEIYFIKKRKTPDEMIRRKEKK